MAFVNEYISDEDWKKYNIQEIEDAFKMGNSSDDSWTIDKENNIFLKEVASSRVDDYGKIWVHWIFLWKKDLYFVTTEIIRSNRVKRGEDYWVHKKIRQFDFYDDRTIDDSLRLTILPYLTNVFMARGAGGVYSAGGGFDMKLELDLA